MDRPRSDSWGTFLFRPVDVASLVFFRIAFGLIMLWEVFRYFDKGWIAKYWIDPARNFPYPGFEWVQAWPGDGMYYHFVVLGVLAVMITLGLAYRFATVAFFVGFTYMFLLEQSRYLNHFYLVCLVSFLLIFVPANRSFSLDVFLKWVRPADKVPRWTVLLLQVQLAIVYFYAGIAKLNGDWLQGEPLRSWLSGAGDMPLIGWLFVQEWVVLAMNYGGLLFDLLVPFALMSTRFRGWGFALAVLFHLMNALLWSIGIFPWMAIALTTIFFAPDWPRRFFRLPHYRTSAGAMPSVRLRGAVTGCLLVWLVFQLGFPLRHWLYSTDVAWTDEGHKYSWRMKLRSRDGRIRFFVTDQATGKVTKVDPADHVASWQLDTVSTSPDVILQFAKHLEREAIRRGAYDVKVTANCQVSLNGRRPQLYFPTDLDLTTIDRDAPRSQWMLPLEKQAPGSWVQN